MNTRCPNCNGRFNVPDEYVGKKVRCTKCQQEFVVTQYIPARNRDEADELEQGEETQQKAGKFTAFMKFDHMMTPGMIELLNWINLICAIALSLVSPLIAQEFVKKYSGGMAFVLASLLIILFAWATYLISRISLEFIAVVFKIHQELRKQNTGK
jgi:predicted Zn finger-like uncharacterized protein